MALRIERPSETVPGMRVGSSYLCRSTKHNLDVFETIFAPALA